MLRHDIYDAIKKHFTFPMASANHDANFHFEYSFSTLINRSESDQIWNHAINLTKMDFNIVRATRNQRENVSIFFCKWFIRNFRRNPQVWCFEVVNGLFCAEILSFKYKKYTSVWLKSNGFDNLLVRTQ